MNIINARVPGYSGLQQIKLEQGIIADITPMVTPTPVEAIDFTGDWLTLGGVDLQINGGLGLAFPDLNKQNVDQLRNICQYLWHQGIDAFLPTIVTTSIEKIQQSLAMVANFIASPQSDKQAKIIGIHLEGPFLNFQKRGAHPAEYLLPLTLENVKEVLGDYAHVVKIITLAPELDATEQIIPFLDNLGITVSLGHSQATARQAEIAFKLGASMVTHAFNAMPGLHHREPGFLGAALINADVYCGFIADGQHICPTMIQLLLSAGGYEQGLFLVSDALAPIGLPDGVYPWDTRKIEVTNGTARLADGTLSGTTLPLLVGVQNLVKWGVCGVETAISLATESPRKAINLPGISAGQYVQLVRWNFEEATNKLIWQRVFE